MFAEHGAEGLSEGGADPAVIGEQARCMLAHDLAGQRGPDRCGHPSPEGPAAHRGEGAPGVRLRGGRHPLPLLELAGSPRIVVGQAWDDRCERPDPGPARRALVWVSDPYPGSSTTWPH